MDMGQTQHAVFCFSADIDISLAGHFRAGWVRGIRINVGLIPEVNAPAVSGPVATE